MELNDTIVAQSSAAGGGGRAVVRLSGPAAGRIASQVFRPWPAPRQRCWLAGELRLADVTAPWPAHVLYWPAPRTYTGQELVELHTLGCPPLVDLLIVALLKHGGRAALPGEFTLRAFLAGKLDLPRAEAVLGVIEAEHPDELRQALAQLAGGLTRPLDGLRDDLLNLLADLEAGLDFADEDIHFVGKDNTLTRLAHGLDRLTQVRQQLAERSLSDRPFRVVLAGPPNAGKSSLFNALTGGQALVSPRPGTTRDYLVRALLVDGLHIELIDTAGWQESSEAIEFQAQALSREQGQAADLVLVCTASDPPPQETAALEKALPIRTKCDLGGSAGALQTSARTGQGLEALRQLLAEQARARPAPPLAPSLSRCRHHVDAALDHLRQAHEHVSLDDSPELAALELRGALDQLGEMVGAVHTDDLLDRIFSRFCIGK